MAPCIAIIGAGAMGTAVARRLISHGCRVISPLGERSAASIARARAAGMISVPFSEIVAADFVLSIVPPSAAHSVARQCVALPLPSARTPIYVDCNAVSPKSVGEIAATIAAGGFVFVDAGIIGPPPADDGTRSIFYAAGAAADRFAALARYGLAIRVLEGPIGAASALKMSFAGMTKGVTAIGTAMLLAATRAGAADALRDELAASRPELLAWVELQVPKMFPKAYRWVGEMEEIAEFSEDPATEQLYLGIARLYQRIADDLQGSQSDKRALDQFLLVKR